MSDPDDELRRHLKGLESGQWIIYITADQFDDDPRPEVWRAALYRRVGRLCFL